MELGVLVKHQVPKKEITDFGMELDGGGLSNTFHWMGSDKGVKLQQLSTSYNSGSKQGMGKLYGDTKTLLKQTNFPVKRRKRSSYVLANYSLYLLPAAYYHILSHDECKV